MEITENFEKIEAINGKLGNVVRENRQMLEAQDKLSEESQEAITAFKIYSEKETPIYKDAFMGVGEAIDMIETNRQAMTAQLREHFLNPIIELNEQWKDIEKKWKNLAKPKKSLRKAQKALLKSQGKAPEKQKPGEIDKAQAKADAAEKFLRESQDQVSNAINTFQSEKNEVIRKVLDCLVTEPKKFHQLSLSTLTDIQMFVEAISGGGSESAPEDPEEELAQNGAKLMGFLEGLVNV